MNFVDYAKIYVKAGDGGDGHVSFRREKFIAKGGPDGGNGGNGGDVVLRADPQLNTLLDFKYKQHYSAQNGANGGKSRKTGKSGAALEIRVPMGVVVKNAESNEIIGEALESDERFVIAKGGSGGFGNAEFATPTNQSPRYAKPGLPGEELEIVLELKLIADVGLVGFPNVGKSTLISVLSSAKPKIADYHFTTLTPNLGIVRVGDFKTFTLVDIPGLIEGASEGKGLGRRFLRHVERTRSLCFLIESTSENPLADYKTLLRELEKYNPDMLDKKRLIAISKMDLVDGEKAEELSDIDFGDDKVFLISAVTRRGVSDLKYAMWETVKS